MRHKLRLECERMKIQKDSWSIIEWKIRRYPQNKIEYNDYIEEIMASSVGNDGQPTAHNNKSVVEAKAMKMNSVVMDRIKKEIEAVELAYNSLQPEEQKVISVRYWTQRWRKIPFHKMPTVSYSERQKRRIAYKMILMVGRYTGEFE